MRTAANAPSVGVWIRPEDAWAQPPRVRRRSPREKRVKPLFGWLIFRRDLSSIAPAHWREARTETDLGDKHLFAWTRIRIGIGDSLAAIVAASAIA